MPTITGASSFAARPLLHALLRRQPQRLLLCDELDAIADLQLQLLPWCEQQRIKTDLQWCCLESQAALPRLPARQWLIHGNNVRAEELLQSNSCTAVRRNIVATQQLLDALPAGGVPLVLLSSHLAARREGVAGSTARCRCGAYHPLLIQNRQSLIPPAPGWAFYQSASELLSPWRGATTDRSRSSARQRSAVIQSTPQQRCDLSSAAHRFLASQRTRCRASGPLRQPAHA